MIGLSFLNQISIFVIDLCGILLAIWVLFVNLKGKINRYFSSMVISYLSWISFYYIMRLPSQINYAFIWAKLGFAGVFIFIIFLYFFSVYFLEEEKKLPILNKFVLVIGSLFSFLSFFTNLIAKKIEITEWGPNPILTSGGKIIFFGSVIFVSVFILVQFFKKYFRTPSRQERLKIQYILIGFSLLIIINIIFNIFLPLKLGSFEYSYFGNYSVIFFLSFTAYAIVKKELFGIKVILTELLVGAIGLILLVQIFIAPTSASRILNGSIFILFVVFSYYLIKATFEESKRREEAEKIAIRESALRKKAEKLATAFKRLDEAKTQFMLATQHHLRTPLTSIQGYLSMLYEGSWGEINPIAKSKIRGALESTQKLIRLVNELLDIAKLEVGKEIITKRETQIEEILQEVINELEPQAKEKGIFLKFEKPEFLPKIMVDLEKIKESIYNLILNGINYTLKGGVTLKLEEKEGKSILISFKDTGIGMKEEEIENLFERIFERGKRAKKLYTTGRGIGLYLASQIIKAHQGKIWAESLGPGKGSTFYIELPIK